jgi:hypothetical protein
MRLQLWSAGLNSCHTTMNSEGVENKVIQYLSVFGTILSSYAVNMWRLKQSDRLAFDTLSSPGPKWNLIVVMSALKDDERRG